MIFLRFQVPSGAGSGRQSHTPLQRYFSALSWLRTAGKQCGRKGNTMAWNTPTLVEICVGLEINGYLPAEF
jgi:coenzyme PQQ precursor peptide PqqA